MKSSFYLTLSAVLLIVGMNSCKKCTVCQYQYREYNKGVWDGVQEIEEFCGSEDEVKDFEADFMRRAEASDHREKTAPYCNRE